MARPTSYTDEIALRLAEVLEQGASIADACALAGIAESTYHEWVRRGETGEAPFSEFPELTRAARARGRLKHVRAIAAAADRPDGKGDWRASAFFLERSDPANWGRRDHHTTELSGPGGGPVAIYLPGNGRDAPDDDPPPAGAPGAIPEHAG